MQPRAVRVLVVLIRALALAAVALGANPAAHAAGAHASARLLAATDAAVPGQPLRLALRLVLAPGWHTYWRNPGDAGAAPVVTVQLDGGSARPAALRFPAPSRLDEGGLTGFGYTGAVTLPFTVAVPAVPATGTLAVRAHADFLVCANVCVPASADLALPLPRAPHAAPSADAPLFAAAADAAPRSAPFRAAIAADGTLRVTGAAIGPVSVRAATVFPFTPGLIDPDAPAPARIAPGELTIALKPQPGFAGMRALDGVLLLTDGAGTATAFALHAPRVAVAIPTLPASPRPAPRPAAASWPVLLALALVGGLLLNAMPCVFPVLALKAMALLRAAAVDRARLRRRALGYAAGTIGTFALLGALLLVLRAGGADAGWGFQFQSPPFVALTALLLGAVALNLAGVFAVDVPFRNAGGAWAGRAGVAGDVATGALAVLVATPCTAPFMGAALAGAMAGPPVAALGVFALLGVGLALPMLLLAASPGLARALPRPGRWTVRVQRLLALPVAAAVVWLLFVLAREAGPVGLGRGTVGLLLVALAAFALPRRRSIAAVALLGAVLAVVPGLRPSTGNATAFEAPAGTERYSAARLAALQAAHRPVLVEMSAAWCLTCLVNERVALGSEAVRDALRSRDAAVLRGDWTARDPAITAFLRRFGSEGVPLAVWFPPGGGAPEVLPAILTAGTLLRHVERSG